MNAKATNTKTLSDLFMAELADMYDAEHRILKALPKLAKVGSSRVDLQACKLEYSIVSPK